MTRIFLGRGGRPLSLDQQSLRRTSATLHVRLISTQKQQRRDDFWIPNVNLKKQDGILDATQLLIRAGYLRQAYSGIYHMLPLGLRVQDKLERLIDKHMRSIHASKVSLSSISSQALWQKSGRLSVGSEFFKFADRKDARWLLAPTHEEEITSLIADVVYSPSQLPIRLYQITRKYRDEKRPRGGLLRGREFIMKDLYTFDINQNEAHVTYDNVRQAYRNCLDELKIKYIEARADSGNMGGSLSHEYHFPSTAGEDDVIKCNKCDYARNEEWVPECTFNVKDLPTIEKTAEAMDDFEEAQTTATDFVDKTRTRLVRVVAPRKINGGDIVGTNPYAVKAAMNGVLAVDTGIEQPKTAFADAISQPTSPDKGTVYYLLDPNTSEENLHSQIRQDSNWLTENDLGAKLVVSSPEQVNSFSLLKQVSGDSCPQCQGGTLSVEKAVEVGHTFHLGTRYSSKLDLKIKLSDNAPEPTPVEMGCHGIGVSRLVAAIASSLSDEVGLNWPRVIAPFEAVLIVDGNDTEKSEVASQVYSSLMSIQGGEVDTLVDDRRNVNNGYKLKDADLIGYPIILVVGKTWQKTRQVEIQCRRLKLKENVDLGDVSSRVRHLLAQL